MTGFVFHDQDEAIDDELGAFLEEGDAPIVFTLGSSAVGAPGAFYEESVRAIEILGRRAVLLVGKYGDAPTGRRGRDVFAAAYAPHASLFARAALVVHHGGVGTTGQALRAGKPMLVVPHAHDQYDNADRVRRLGAARVVDARRYRAETVAVELRRLITEPAYARGAAAAGVAVSGEHGADAACAAMLALCGA